jgi:hypothetical protein
VSQVNVIGITPVAGTPFKYATAAQLDNYAMSSNGGISTDVSGTMPVGPINVLRIGANTATTTLYGGIKNVRIWASRLSNGQLQVMTT